MNANDPLRALQDALRLSPDNLPLSQHYAGVTALVGFATDSSLFLVSGPLFDIGMFLSGFVANLLAMAGVKH